MKYTVKIGEKTFSVEVDDINQRPVVARVDGEKFEVSPENGSGLTGPVLSAQITEIKPGPVSAFSSGISSSQMVSPLPGTVIEIFVEAGDEVEAGTTLLIIEAMKMKNSIRSVRAGKIAQVLVSAGQTVSHKQPLVEFAP